MSRRPAFTDRRRARLAQKVNALEALEPKYMITESLFSLGLGLGLHASSFVGPKHAGAESKLKADHRPAGHRSEASTIPIGRGHHGHHSAGGHAAVVTPTPKPVAPATSGDWLTLSAPADPPANTGVAAKPTGLGGGALGGGGAGPDASGTIRPARFSPPQDLSTASSTLVAAAPPANSPTAANTANFAGAASGGAPASPPPASAPSTPGPVGSRFAGGVSPFILVTPPDVYRDQLTSSATGSKVALGQFTNFPLYVLDYNHGTTLFPGFDQIGVKGNNFAGTSVDLRAQVRDTTGVTFSWDTTNLTHATNISGKGTYDLTFNWSGKMSFPAGVDWLTDSVTLTATNGASKTEIQTFTFDIPKNISGSSGSTTWPESLAPDLQLSASPSFGSHNVSVDATSGAVDAAIQLAAYSPVLAGLQLNYDSMAADPRPIVVEHHKLDDSKADPSQVTASLTFNGSTASTAYYDTSQFIAGDIQQIALQADATGVGGTGRYAYTVNLGDIRSGITTTSTASGTLTVLDESGNAIGAGWTLSGLQAITPASGGVILALGGGDRSLWFSGSPGSGGGTYTTPAGDFSTLAKTGSGTYTRTLIDGTVLNFDTSGRESSAVDTKGNRTTFAYDGSSRLTTITDAYSQNTVLGYSGGLLQTVTDPASRIATFTHSGSNLTGVTLPDSGGWSYAYDGSHRLTTITDPNSHASVVTYDSVNRAGTITRPDATTENFKAEQERGYVAGTSSGSPGAATLLAEARGSHTDPNAHTTDVRPDWNGQGMAGQGTDPDGFVATADRDANGLATLTIDRINRYTQATYDASGRAVTVTHQDLTTTHSDYNAFSEVTDHADENGNLTTFTYDGSGNLTVVKDALNNLTTMTYTGTGQVATVKDANSHVTSFQYDSQDRRTTITYPAIGGAASALTTIVYDSKGNVATLIDERGNATTHSYDALNRLTGTTDALTNKATYTYDSGGNLTLVQAPLSRTSTLAYDTMDRLTTLTDPLSHATTYTYDSGGNLKTATDALGRTTTLAYDPEDRRTVTTSPLSGGTTGVATLTYDGEGQVVASADALNRITTTAYNGRGWAAVVTDPLGNATTFLYTNTGHLSTKSQYAGVTLGVTSESYGYDALDRIVTVGDALGRIATTVYDAVGNVTADQQPLSRTTSYAYDARNRLTTVTDPLSHSTVTAYDSGGNATSVTDPLSHATTYGFDALNRVTTITDARLAVTTIAYDAAGRRTGLTDPNGNHTTWAYDAADRMTTETAPVPGGQNGVSTYVYDAANQLTDKTDRDARRTTYAYDSGGRLTNERWLDASGGTVQTITYTYDADSEMTGVIDPNATLTFTYDSGGRTTAAGTSGGGTGQPAVTLTYGYDNVANRTSLTDSLASVGRTTYQYDAAFRLTTINQTFGGTAGPQVALGYDDGNRLTSLSRTIGGSGTAVVTSLSYDAADRVTTIIHQVSGGAVLASYAYAYDNANRLTTETYTGTTVAYNYSVTYTYDAANELTTAGGSRTETYGYDSGGNRNTAGYVTAAGNELTAAPGFTYAYDAQGDTTAQTETATGKVTTYSYDYRDRLTGVTQKDNKAAVIMQATYTYDALNRRIGTDVDVDGSGPNAPVQTWMVYDGQNTYADFNGSGTLLTRYLYGPAVDQLLARTTAGGATAWYLTDQLGSVRDIANTTGSVIDHVAYDSFGGISSESTPSSGDRFKFASRENDATVGLNYNRARYYNSSTGRFTKQDPKGFEAGDTNLYRYVRNGPLNATDPSGLEWEYINGHWEWVGPRPGPYPYLLTPPWELSKPDDSELYMILFKPGPSGSVGFTFQVPEYNLNVGRPMPAFGDKPEFTLYYVLEVGPKKPIVLQSRAVERFNSRYGP